MRPRPVGSPALFGPSRDGGHRVRPSRRRRVAVALVGWLAVPVLSAAPALAGVGLGVTPEFPESVTVGQAGVAATLRIENVAFGGEGENSATLNDITLVPSCGVSPAAPPDVDCTGGEDPGAFQLSAGGTGAAGTACAGTTFTITEIDPISGRYRFTPDQAVVLGPPGTAAETCVINFTFDVARLPARDAFPAEPGVQTTQVGFSTATFSPSGLTGSGTGTDVTTVAQAVPTINTQAPATATVGQPISDVATLAGGASPTGAITFQLFGPDDAVCAGAPVFTSTTAVDGNGQYTSDAFTPTAPGTYRWVAAYGGDADNAAVTTACGEANEITQVAEVADLVVSPPTTIGPAFTPSNRARPPGGVLPRTGAAGRTLVMLGGLLLAVGRVILVGQRRLLVGSKM